MYTNLYNLAIYIFIHKTNLVFSRFFGGGGHSVRAFQQRRGFSAFLPRFPRSSTAFFVAFRFHRGFLFFTLAPLASCAPRRARLDRLPISLYASMKLEGLEAILGGHFPFLSFQSLSDVRKSPEISRKSAV